MADKEIGDLTAASALDGTETVHVVQGGNSRRTTTQGIADLTNEALTDLSDVDVSAGLNDGDVLVYEASSGKFYPAALTAKIESLVIACSDETTALTAGTGKITFRMPYAFNLTEIPRASLTTAQASGNIFTVDINESGGSILSTKLTIDNTEKTSKTAAAPAVLSDSFLADDAEITIDIDQIGDGTAKGLKIYLIGYRT